MLHTLPTTKRIRGDQLLKTRCFIIGKPAGQTACQFAAAPEGLIANVAKTNTQEDNATNLC
jgi:hypothetical protein